MRRRHFELRLVIDEDAFAGVLGRPRTEQVLTEMADDLKGLKGDLERRVVRFWAARQLTIWSPRRRHVQKLEVLASDGEVPARRPRGFPASVHRYSVSPSAVPPVHGTVVWLTRSRQASQAYTRGTHRGHSACPRLSLWPGRSQLPSWAWCGARCRATSLLGLFGHLRWRLPALWFQLSAAHFNYQGGGARRDILCCGTVAVQAFGALTLCTSSWRRR